MSLNMDDGRINSYILRAEQNGLSSILSPELYFALKSATITPGDRFDKLFNGDEYNEGSNYPREWVGVKQLLCAYAFSIIAQNNPIHITRGGNVRKIGEQTENTTTREANDLAQQAYSEGIRLEGEFYKWMTYARVDYPEYNGGIPSKSASFNFFNSSKSCRYSFLERYAWEVPYP